jgi:hypothetical protein
MDDRWSANVMPGPGVARASCAPVTTQVRRIQADLSRERAAHALYDDFAAVLAALRRGLGDKDARKAASVAVSYVQLVYGRQLQQPKDEDASDPLDVASLSREERDALKRRTLAQHPHLVSELRGES